jgi:hypothetical protein
LLPPSPVLDLQPWTPRNTTAAATAARLNERFRRKPWHAFWPADGTLADAGLLIRITGGGGFGAVPARSMAYDGMCSSMVFAGQKEANALIPVINNGPTGVVFRPGVAQILCGKPRDSSGSCHFGDCPRTGHLNSCMWRGNDTGYFMEMIKGYGGYNEIVLNASHWPSDIVEASFGDPLLPEPHLRFDHTDWVSPFSA